MRTFTELSIKEKWRPKEKKTSALAHDELSSIGDQAVADFLGVKVKKGDGYDLIFKGLKINVRTVETHDNVNPVQRGFILEEEYKPDQGCDVYVFVRTRASQGKLWITGWISRDDFNRKAILKRKGEMLGCRPTDKDARGVRLNRLKDIEELKEVVE